MAEGRRGAKVLVTSEDVDLDGVVKGMIKGAVKLGGGSLVVYTGFVKAVTKGGEVAELQVSVEDIEGLRAIANRALGVEGVIDVFLAHRVGSLRPGDVVLVIAVTATSRHPAFKAAREILEAVKGGDVVRKVEVMANGTRRVVKAGMQPTPGCGGT